MVQQQQSLFLQLPPVLWMCEEISVRVLKPLPYDFSSSLEHAGVSVPTNYTCLGLVNILQPRCL